MNDRRITTFRFVPRDLRSGMIDPAVESYLDTLHRQAFDRLHGGGEAFVPDAEVDTRYAAEPSAAAAGLPEIR